MAGHQPRESMSQRWLRNNHYWQKISMHLVCIILNFTIRWEGLCIASYRSMETPPELVVLCENIVSNGTSQCQGPAMLWSVLQGNGHSSPQSEKPVCQGLTHQVLSYACCLPLKQWLVLSGFSYFHFVQTLQKMRYILCSATLVWKQDGWRLAV